MLWSVSEDRAGEHICEYLDLINILTSWTSARLAVFILSVLISSTYARNWSRSFSFSPSAISWIFWIAYSRIWNKINMKSGGGWKVGKNTFLKVVVIPVFLLGKVGGTCGFIVRAYVWAFCLARVTQRAEASRIDRQLAGWLAGWPAMLP